MKKFLNVSRVSFAILTLFLLAAPTESFAQVVPPCIATSTFDAFTTGTVNGQSGWHVTGPFDQEVVSNTFGVPTFGCKSLRISNATTSVFIFNQTFSNNSANEAGESASLDSTGTTGTTRNRFEAQFDLASVMSSEQPGMHMSVSPDRGDGTRMSDLGFVDTASGIDVFFHDYTGTSDPLSFNEVQVASGLSRTAHTVKFIMDFVEGASNDIVKIFIDGNLVHTGTSWENFYRFDPQAFPAPNPALSRTVRSLVFYEQSPGNPANQFNGFLIDNLVLSATSTPVTSTSTATTTPPVITLQGTSPMDVFINSVFTDPGATAIDSASTSLVVASSTDLNIAVLGTYTIVYTATDSNNNTASTTRIVNVVAAPASTTTPPVITLVGGASIDVVQNTTFVDPGFSAVDSASTSVPVIATGTVDTAVVGSYVITYTATDTNNNVATTTRTVNVLAAPVATSTVPIITLLGNSPMIVFINSVFSDPGATAISGTTTVPVIASGTVDTSVIGSNTILYTATGTNNDVATTTRIVNVISTSTPPTITLNGSSTIDVTINTTFVDPGATSSDAVGNPITPTATGTVNITALGTYTILYTATDTNNNVATTTRTVNVVAAPVPAPVTTSGGGGGGGRFFPPVPGLPAGFVFAPLNDQSTTGTTGSTVSPVVVGTVNPPTGQVTGQVLGASVFNFTRNLGFGSRGLDVMELQKILIASGHLVLGTPTQYFGTLTRAALRKWQTQHSIISTGFFGPLSRAEVLRQ